MERKHKKLALAVLVIFLLSFLMNKNKERYEETAALFSTDKTIMQNCSSFINYAFKNKMPINDISFVNEDDDKNIFLIANGASNIIKLNDKNTILLNIKEEKQEEKSYFGYVVADAQGYVYVLKTTLNESGLYVNKEEIQRYTPQGLLDKTIYQSSYKKGEKNMRVGQIKKLEIKEDWIYFYAVKNSEIGVKRINLKESTKIENVYTFPAKADMQLYDVSTILSTYSCAVTRGGDIYNFDVSGMEKNIFTNKESGKEFMPYKIQTYKNQTYILDYFTKGITRLKEGNGNEQFIVNMNVPSYKEDFSTKFNELVNFCITKDGRFIAYNYNKIFFMNEDGRITSSLSEMKRTQKDIMGLWLFWVLGLLTIAVSIESIWLVYTDFMERKIPLIVKEILIVAPILLIMTVILMERIYIRTNAELDNQMRLKLTAVAKSGVKFIDGDSLEKLNSPQDFMNKEYINTTKNIRFAYTADQDDQQGMFNVIFKLKEETGYFILDDDASTSFYRPADMSFGGDKILFDKMMNGGEEYAKSKDSYGSWVNIKEPIYNSKGMMVGMYEVGMYHRSFDSDQMKIVYANLRDIVAMATCSMIAFILITMYVLRSIRVLKQGVDEIAAGNMDVVVEVNSSDEISTLCMGFNKMAEHIRKFTTKITEMNKAYYYFVPEQFLKLLGKKDIYEIKLGDNIKKDMGLLYSKLITVQVLSKNAEENFKFINSYLNSVGPIIRDHQGIIEKYLGVDISAIFAEKISDAIVAAIEICNRLTMLNKVREENGEQLIEMGIGIYHDSLMLGIIGEEKRLEGTVISDNGRICEFLSELTQKVSAKILVTENTFKMLEKSPDFKYRDIGQIYLEAKNQSFEIYDIYESDSIESIELKDQTKEAFEEGIALYKQKNFHEAREKFVEVIRENSFDEAAKLYFYLCDQNYRTGVESNWNAGINFKERMK